MKGGVDSVASLLDRDLLHKCYSILAWIVCPQILSELDDSRDAAIHGATGDTAAYV